MDRESGFAAGTPIMLSFAAAQYVISGWMVVAHPYTYRRHRRQEQQA